ncbi:DUF305 domain-containing protein [Actinoplanes sp. NPDC051633]|uniref:DUF305 domain-containing protein n=1 Tax=Actinoplanes sp. NPDC051633 TaxID=3155670 RepID=UPI00343A7B58
MDVGFVRDMVIHHSQAVTLAMIVMRRATVPAVREMADEIATTQQREAGVMSGWLQQWGLPTSTAAPAMSWMTHPPATPAATDPPMPGMATRRDVARLAVTRGPAADLLFSRLMLAHHLGGLHMINEVIARGRQPEVIALAEQMRTAQQREINQLNPLLAQITSSLSPVGMTGVPRLGGSTSAVASTGGSSSPPPKTPGPRPSTTTHAAEATAAP